MLKTIEQVEERLNNRKCRSAWDKGVNAYALELLDNLAAALAWQQLEQIPEDWKPARLIYSTVRTIGMRSLGVVLP